MRFLTVAVTALAALPCGLAIPNGKSSKLTGSKSTNNDLTSLRRPGSLDVGRTEAKSNDFLGGNSELAAKIKANSNSNSNSNSNNRKVKTTDIEIIRPELTAEEVCEAFEFITEQIDAIYLLVKKVECGCDSSSSWTPIIEALYQVELYLDSFDVLIDSTDLSKCFTCAEESKIACCYREYAEALIELLELIADKIEYVDGETAFFIVTAINSLRDSDFSLTNEILRRLQCEESIYEIAKKEGAQDGSTPGSIREAFALFVSTPYINGDEFKSGKHGHGKGHGHGHGHGHGQHHSETPSTDDLEIVEGIKHKNKHHGAGHRPCKQKSHCPVPSKRVRSKAADATVL